MVVQNGNQKLMLVSAFTDALKALMADTATEMWTTLAVPAHTHSESDITNLTNDLMMLANAIASKAALNHVHPIGDIQSNYIDATVIPPVVYNGVFEVTTKATVAGGNAVFQFTDDGLATGNALFPSGPIGNSELFRAEEGQTPTTGSAHFFGKAVWSNGNKTCTVPVAKTGAGISVALLGLTLLGQNVAANGSVIYATAKGH